MRAVNRDKRKRAERQRGIEPCPCLLVEGQGVLDRIVISLGLAGNFRVDVILMLLISAEKTRVGARTGVGVIVGKQRTAQNPGRPPNERSRVGKIKGIRRRLRHLPGEQAQKQKN